MSVIRAGEVWKLLIAGEARNVTVAGVAGTPGWWECIDIQTGMRFLARESWFVECLEAEP